MALTTHVRRPLRRARIANRIRNLGCTCDGTIIEQKALLSRELLSPSTATQTPLLMSIMLPIQLATIVKPDLPQLTRGFMRRLWRGAGGLMCQSRLTRRSLLRAESSCPNKAAKPCEPPSLASWNGEKTRRTMDPDDTSSILWRRRCYKRVIERSTWNCFCVTAACSNGAAVEICSAADHIGGGAY